MRRLLLLLLCAVGVTTATAAQSPASPSEGLALFDEVWKTINESFYDPTFGGLNWSGVRDELRPKAAAASSTDAARAVVNEMLGRLKRSHFALLSGAAASDDMTPKGEATVDLDVRVLDSLGVVVTRDASGAVAGSQTLLGRRILSIDEHMILPVSGTPKLTLWRQANALLYGADGSTAVIQLDGGQRVKAARRMPSGARVQFSNLPPLHVQVSSDEAKTPSGRRVGVIGFNIWMAQINEPVARAIDRFRDADGLVIDLRGNPGGLAAMISNVAGHLVDQPSLLGTMQTRSAPNLKFIVNPRTTTTDGRSVKPYAGPVAVIVDEMTASASECFAGALQDLGRVRVFGRTSMGAALPASTKRLANGDVLEYVIGDFVTGKGRSLEGTGVVPDEMQPLSVASLSAGHDDSLIAALAWIDRQPRAVRQPAKTGPLH